MKVWQGLLFASGLLSPHSFCRSLPAKAGVSATERRAAMAPRTSFLAASAFPLHSFQARLPWSVLLFSLFRLSRSTVDCQRLTVDYRISSFCTTFVRMNSQSEFFPFCFHFCQAGWSQQRLRKAHRAFFSERRAMSGMAQHSFFSRNLADP